MKVSVIGLGKIGLPISVYFAKHGLKVHGVDINSKIVESVNKGFAPFAGEENLQTYLSEVVSKGSLVAHTDSAECLGDSETIIVVVPLVVDKDGVPDFDTLDQVTLEIAKKINRGTLVCYETTLPVGTTRNRFTRKIEEVSGFKVGLDFHVVFSPERVFSGRIFQDLDQYPKIVGGVTEACSKIGFKFYSKALNSGHSDGVLDGSNVTVLKDAETAEFVKLAETTYRDVNIALANQFAKSADKWGINIKDVIDTANSQPFSHIHQPSISIGGHCIPVYPKFYLWQDPSMMMIRNARAINESMPRYVVEKMAVALDGLQKKRVLVAGLSYRIGIKEVAYSGVYSLIDELKSAGAVVTVDDFDYTPREIASLGFSPVTDYSEIQAVVIHTEDSRFDQGYLDMFCHGTLLFRRLPDFFKGEYI